MWWWWVVDRVVGGGKKEVHSTSIHRTRTYVRTECCTVQKRPTDYHTPQRLINKNVIVAIFPQLTHFSVFCTTTRRLDKIEQLP
jgi:hypothetical protein